MSRFDRIPINLNELMIWKRDPLVNPRTKRKIKHDGLIFKYINDNYELRFPFGFDIFDSNDHRDPISLNNFYNIDTSGNKKLIHQNPEELILYRESDNIIRCFEKRSLIYLKSFKINNHPISQKLIPSTILDLVNENNTPEDLTVTQKALNVFQLFTSISIFIDYKLFLKLSKVQLKRFNYELRDFYYQNISEISRKKIDNSDGKKILKHNDFEIEKLDDESIKIYLLDQIEILLKHKEEEDKFMINYIILGALSLVIDEVKEIYDNFNFSF